MALSGGVYGAKDVGVGLVAYGGVLVEDGEAVTVLNKDTVKRRVYIVPLSPLVEVDAGIMDEFTYNPVARTVDLSIIQPPEGPVAEAAVIWVDSRSETAWAVASGEADNSRGSWRVPLGAEGTTVRLEAQNLYEQGH